MHGLPTGFPMAVTHPPRSSPALACSSLRQDKLVRQLITAALDHAARQCAGRLAVAEGDLAGDDRRVVARCLLHQALAAGWQVVGHVRTPERQAVVVDDVEVGLLADGYDAAVAETGRSRRVRRQAADQLLDRPAVLLV